MAGDGVALSSAVETNKTNSRILRTGRSGLYNEIARGRTKRIVKSFLDDKSDEEFFGVNNPS